MKGCSRLKKKNEDKGDVELTLSQKKQNLKTDKI